MDQKDLIEKSMKGDEEAFRQLFNQYQGKIFNTCLGIVKDQGIAEDMTQETFLQAYAHLETFRGKSSIYTWMYRIAYNLSLNQLKKMERGKTHLLKEELIEINDTSQNVDPKEFSEMLEEALSLLSDKARLVYILCEVEKRPQKEVAALLNIKEGTLRSRLFYARKKIKGHFSNSASNFL